MKTVRLIECFNFTWQGEGPDSGKKMLLLRFKRCNRNCKWCDTKVKMRMVEEAEYPINDLQKMIEDNNLGVMVTGGEPTFGNNLPGAINIINGTKAHIYNVETNGLQLEELIKNVNPSRNIKYILSPKVFTSNDKDFYIDLVSKVKDNSNVFIKLVYESDSPLLEIFIMESLKLGFNSNRIWLMPQGTTRDELIKNSPCVFDACERHRINFSSRNHVMYEFV